MCPPEKSALRGYEAIATLIARMTPLADWLFLNRPAVSSITLTQRDFDLILRSPDAAGLHGICFREGQPFWRSYALTPDKPPVPREKKIQ